MRRTVLTINADRSITHHEPAGPARDWSAEQKVEAAKATSSRLRGWVMTEVIGLARTHFRGIQLDEETGEKLDVVLESTNPLTDDEVLRWKTGHFDGTNTTRSATIGVATSPTTGKRGVILPVKE